jgi:isopenicillin N synthase-like dioxygenase
VTALPVVDIAPLRAGTGADGVAAAIDQACRATGFFYVTGHGVPAELPARVDAFAREFFALPDETKARIAMPKGGRAWRGWFPLGGELTSGVADWKEGLYFGEELADDDPRVRARWPLHGANLFPDHPAGLRAAVLELVDALTAVGHTLLRGVSRALELDDDWFDRNLTASPTVLFRIFRYPPLPSGVDGADGADGAGAPWSVGEHTDYGLLTILVQDEAGGLEVRGPDAWIAAPPLPGAFVVNLGDMLERMTGGRYRSTPHRVRNAGPGDRLSLPLFLDPAWDAEVRPVPNPLGRDTARDADRWDRTSVHEWSGTYGEYLFAKVSKVFPALVGDVMHQP